MVAVVSGNSLGLELTSLRTLGAQGVVGDAVHGRNKESVFVNAANGNLVVQDKDDVIAQRGPDAAILRTYNSQGLFSDDNADNWSDGLAPAPLEWTGAPNASTSTVKRRDLDGSDAVYRWSPSRNAYFTTDGDGAHDTITFIAADNQFEWRDGTTGASERYAADSMRMVERRDGIGNAVSYSYDASGRLVQVMAPNGDRTVLDRSGANITQIRRIDAQGSTTTSVRYTYDGENRLSVVAVDLGAGSVYTTTYTYEPGSRRLATLAQSDGTVLAFTYQLCAGASRVASVRDGAGTATWFSYDANGRMTACTTDGLTTFFGVDAAGQLTSISPPGFAGQPAMTFGYDSEGNVTSVIDGAGRSTAYAYENGNRVRERNGQSAVDRQFDSKNRVVWESASTGLDPDGLGPIQATGVLATRSVYDRDGRNLLRFAVSAEGRVSEYRYDGFGNRVAELAYRATYALDPLLAPGGLTLDAMEAWSAGQQGAIAQRTDATFNARGQLLSRTAYANVAANEQGVTDGSQSVEQFVYDQRGLLLQKIAAAGGSTVFTYDGLGRELTRRDAAGQLTVTQYQDSQRKTVVTSANGLVTTTTYDIAGRLVATLESSASSANLGETTYSYDASGRRRMSVDPTGVRHWWLWNDAGRCVGEVDGNGTLTESVYERGGLLASRVAYATAVSTSLLVDGTGNARVTATLADVRPVATTSDMGEWRTYDASGRLVQLATSIGTGSSAAVVAYFYDGAGRQVARTEYATAIPIAGIQPGTIPLPNASSQDRTTRSFHDKDGRLAGTLDPEGFLVRFTHDAAGRVVERLAYATPTPESLRASGTLDDLLPGTSPFDQRTVTLHDAKGQVAAVIDAEGYVTEMAYDANGNLVRSTRYANRAALPVTPSSVLATIRPAASGGDQVTTRVFDTLDRLQQEAAPEGVTTTFAYDSAGNTVSTIRAVSSSDERSLLYRFDAQGRLTKELTPEGAAQLAAATSQAGVDAIWARYAVTHAYDAAGRRTCTTDATGHKTLYYYDADGAVVFTVNALGEIRESRYDVLGRETSRITRATRISAAGLAGGLLTAALQEALSPSSSSDSTETITYTRDGRVSSRTDAEGGTTTFTLNAFGDVIGSSQLVSGSAVSSRNLSIDRRGQLRAAVEDPGGLNLLTTTVYDAFGRVVSTTDATGQVSTRAYDRLGRTVTMTDPLNAVRSTTYDAFGRVLTQTDSLGATTTYSYDTAARSVRVTTPEGFVTVTTNNRHGQVQQVTDGSGQTTSYTYDRQGRLLQTTTPLGTMTRSAYDDAGRLVSTVDANGTTVAYTYDAADRVLTRTVDPGGLALATTWLYDAKGQAVSVRDANDVETTFAFDNAGRVLRQTVQPGGLNLQTVFTYDRRGKTLTVTSPQGTVTQYVYDAAGRRTAEIVNPGGLNLTRTWSHDGQGRVIAATDGAGNTTRYAYDAAGQLVFTVDATGGVQQQVYDAAGRVTKTVHYATPITLASLPSIQPVPQPNDQVEHRVYDRDGRLAATVDGTGAVVRFAYDARGNVTSRTSYANRIAVASWQPGTVPQPQADPAHDQKTSFVYDALDRVRFTVDGAGAVVEQAYDNNGNVVRRTAYAASIAVPASVTPTSVQSALVPNPARDATTRSTYDAANRLTWTVDGAGAVVQRQYDRNGNLVRSTSYAKAIGPTQAPQAVLADASIANDRVSTRYFDAANRLVFEIDAIGAVRETSYDRDGRVLKQVDYATIPAAAIPEPTLANAAATLKQSLSVATADRGTRFSYDAAGRLAARMDGEGAVLKFQYDGAGRLLATIALARTLYWPAFAGNALSSLLGLINADAADRKTVRAYDAAGRLVYEVAGMGETTGYLYDGAGRLTRKTRYSTLLPAGSGTGTAQIGAALLARPASDAALDRVESMAYDASGNLLSTTDANGAIETFTYDALGGKLSFTNRRGAVWFYEHDAAGRIVQETSPVVELARTSIDANGSVVLVETASTSVVNRFVFDALGNLVQRTEAAGRPEQRITSYEYDVMGRQTRVVHPQVGIYAAGIDNLQAAVQSRAEQQSILETRTFYDVLGNAVAGRDAGGALSQKVYDRAGRVEFEIDALGQVTRYARNAFGEVTALTRHANATTLGATQFTAAASSSARNQVLSALANSTADRTVATTYDRAGRVVKVQEPAALTFDSGAQFSWSALDTTQATTETTYNAFGEAIRVARLRNLAEATSSATTHFFDKSGQEVATVDALGYLTKRSFDARGNLIRIQEFASAITPGAWTSTAYNLPAASVDDRATTFAYDKLDRKVSERKESVTYSTSANGTTTVGDLVTSYGYDALGNLTRTTDASGGNTFTAYDALGRILAVAAPARASTVSGASVTPVTTFKRDAFGNVVVQTESADGATAAGETGIVASAGQGDHVTRTAYDGFGRAIASLDANQNASFTSYDAWGHVAKTWRGVTGFDGQLRTTFQVNQYDAVGQLVGVIEPAPVSASVQVVPLARLMTDTPTGNKLVLSWSGLTHPSVGDVRAVVYYRHRTMDEYAGVVVSSDSRSSAETAASQACGGVEITWFADVVAVDGIRIEQKNAGGLWTSVWQGSLADARGGSMTLQQAGTVDTGLEYNAFGELTRKGVQGGGQEYFDYDNAGRLWRTNTGDGVDRIRLFDAEGHVTAEMTSGGIGGNNQRLRLLDSAQAALATEGLRRVDTTYDLLGRVTSQTLAARSESTSAVAVQRIFLPATVGQSSVARLDAAGTVQEWAGTNSVQISSSAVAGLGSGDVKVRIDYVTADVGSRTGVARSWSSAVVDASTFAGSFTARWTDPLAPDGGIARVSRIVVQKKDVYGAWVTVADQAPGYGANFVDVTAPADHGVRVKLEFRAAGTTGWWEASAPADFGDKVRFDATALAVGGYEYRLTLVSPVGEQRVAATGTLNVAKPPLTAITAPIAYSPTEPGILAWSSPGTSMGQVFRYRLAGGTGPWSILNVLPRAGGKDGVDTAAFPAGRYDYELVWTPVATGVPSSHATGQFTVVAAVPSQWVPPANLPALGNVRIASIPGSVHYLLWDLANANYGATVARMRPVGGSWTTLPITTETYGYDEYGMLTGRQYALLGAPPAVGTYELQVSWGSPPTHQATATLTVYGASPGYYVTDWVPQQVYRPVIAGYDYYGNIVYAYDENGNVLMEYAWTWVPVQRWVPGSIPAPSLSVTTPPYVPGYWTAAVPTQYLLSPTTSPGSLEISGSEGSTLAQAVATAESARSSRPQVFQKTDRWGNVVEVTDPRSAYWKTTYKLNAFNQVVRETRPVIDPGAPVTETFYDALGRQVAVKDANGNLNGQVFDAGGNLVQELHADGGVVSHRYDAFGNRVRTTDGEGRPVTFTYDALGRLLSRQQGAVAFYSALSTNWLGDVGYAQLTDSWTYDQLGRKLTQTNGNGEILRYRYDLRGNLVETIQPLGHSVRATFDAQGRKTREIDANGLLATWTYEYFGHLTGHVDIGGAAYTYGYDNALQQFMQTNTRGQALSFMYDAAGQRTSIVDAANGTTTTYAYDLAGRKLRETVVRNGVTYQDNRLAYDALGNLRDVADARVHLVMAYDLAGNRSRVKTILNYQGVGGETNSWIDRYYRYDAMNRQTTVDAVDSAGNLGAQGHQLAYDKSGNRVRDQWQVTGPTGALSMVTEDYAYDAMNRLLSAMRGSKTVDMRRYDKASRVVFAGPGGGVSAAEAAAMNQGVPSSQAIGADTRINRYDANGRLLHQKVLDSGMQVKSDLIWDPSETAGETYKADGYDAAGNTLGWVVKNLQSAPAIAAYRTDLQRFEGYVGRFTDGAGTMATPAMTKQSYDANGFLTGVTDPSRADGNRSFVNDSAGHALYVNQAGRVQRQLVVDGEVLGAYGVGVDPVTPSASSGNPNFGNIVDFDFGYSKISAAYPTATPGAYQVRPGDTLQSIAQSAYGDSKLWYRIADANGLALSSGMRVGQTLNIPSGVGTISNNGSTFKPYDASRVVGETAPSMMPAPADAGGGCGGAGKLLMVVVAVVVSIYMPQAVGGGFLNSMFTAATAAAASEITGGLTGGTDDFNWKSVALSAISGGIASQVPVLKSLSPGIQQPVRMAVTNALAQAVGVVTGLQSRFDWRGVAASFAGTWVGQEVGNALDLPENSGKGAMLTGDFLLKATLKSFAAGLTTAVARGGRIAVQQVAIDAFGNAIGYSAAYATSRLEEYPSFTPATEEEARSARNDGLLRRVNAIADPEYYLPPWKSEDQYINQKAAKHLLDYLFPQSGTSAIFKPGVDDPVRRTVSELGGHVVEPLIIGQMFVGAMDPETKERFDIGVLNLLIAHSQFKDTFKGFDALVAGVRYAGAFLPFSGISLEDAQLGLATQEGPHSINGKGVSWNVKRNLDLLETDPRNPALAGDVLHSLRDASPHDGYPNIVGHLRDSLTGKSPDYVTPKSVRDNFEPQLRLFEIVTGVSAETVLPGYTQSIRARAFNALEEAIGQAGVPKTNAEFEAHFIETAQNYMPEGALRIPRLPMWSVREMLTKSTVEEALATTAQYLSSVNMTSVDPRGFLFAAATAHVKSVNNYLLSTGGRLSNGVQVRPMTIHDLFAAPRTRGK